MSNADIAEIFREIASLLAVQGANPFRVRAYERAADLLAALPTEACGVFRAGDLAALRELPGIGDDLAEKIAECCRRGRLAYLARLRKEVPHGLLEVLAVEGMGPTKTRFVWKEFRVRTLRDFTRVLASGRLARVRGWGDQSVASIRRAVAMHEAFGERLPIGRARPLAEAIVEQLRASGCCDRVEIAGSLRRWKETIGDLDILATSRDPARAMAVFCALPEVRRVISRGDTKANVLLTSGIEADLRVLDPDVFGAALHYFTGSKQHNIATRKIAIAKGLTVSEYGVFRRSRTSASGGKERKGRLVACRTEGDVFRAIGLPEIPPEIREDTGEIEAAKRGRIPVLVRERDIRGDLHCHSTFSDGSATMEEMIAAAKRAGLEYVAMTDHASVMGMVGGMKTFRGPASSVQRRASSVSAYVKRVRAAAQKVRGIRVLAGAEVDILADGSLYLADEELAQLDWVVAAIHASFKQTAAQATERLVRAMAHPAVQCIGHPTTRLLGKRAGMEFDWEPVMAAAKRHGVALELNASWMRLDLDDVHARMAVARGVRIAMNSDAHAAQEFDWRYGVHQARRGWVTARDVINTLPWGKFSKQYLR